MPSMAVCTNAILLRLAEGAPCPFPKRASLQFRSCLDRASSRGLGSLFDITRSNAQTAETFPSLLDDSTTIATSDSPASTPRLISILWQCIHRWPQRMKRISTQQLGGSLSVSGHNRVCRSMWQDGGRDLDKVSRNRQARSRLSLIRAQMPDRS